MGNVIQVPIEKWKPRPNKPTIYMNTTELRAVLDQIILSQQMGFITAAEAEERYNEVTEIYKLQKEGIK